MPNCAMVLTHDIYCENQGIKKTKTKNRFEELCFYLHFSNSICKTARGDVHFHCLFKVIAVLQHVCKKCENNFMPTKNIAVDNV